MNPQKAELLARKLIEECLPDEGWKFKFDNAKRRFGSCQYSTKTISLSRPLTIVNDESEVRNTILHEIAHALTPGHGHGYVWKKACELIGAKPERCYDDNKVNTPTAPYGLYCPSCDVVVADRYRKTGTVFLHNACKTRVEWVTYG